MKELTLETARGRISVYYFDDIEIINKTEYPKIILDKKICLWWYSNGVEIIYFTDDFLESLNYKSKSEKDVLAQYHSVHNLRCVFTGVPHKYYIEYNNVDIVGSKLVEDFLIEAFIEEKYKQLILLNLDLF